MQTYIKHLLFVWAFSLVTFQRLFLLATEAMESMLICKWGREEMKREGLNWGTDIAPHTSFRACFEKKQGEKATIK